MKDCYQNKESREIEKTINDWRKDSGMDAFLPLVKVYFKKKEKQK